MVTPRGESRSDNDIVFSLACRLGMQSMFFDGELDRAWNHQLVPRRVRSHSVDGVVFSLSCRLGMQSRLFDGELYRAWNHQPAPLVVTVADLRGSPDGSLRVPMVHHDRKYGRPRAGASDDAHGS